MIIQRGNVVRNCIATGLWPLRECTGWACSLRLFRPGVVPSPPLVPLCLPLMRTVGHATFPPKDHRLIRSRPRRNKPQARLSQVQPTAHLLPLHKTAEIPNASDETLDMSRNSSINSTLTIIIVWYHTRQWQGNKAKASERFTTPEMLLSWEASYSTAAIPQVGMLRLEFKWAAWRGSAGYERREQICAWILWQHILPFFSLLWSNCCMPRMKKKIL